ncbi:MAG: pyrroline-5-carboxylate reductase [Deltaproteobacteria bacterium]|nr:pyrroline-5-carboxylate reductase [Deltaproteobacteria bacterium]
MLTKKTIGFLGAGNLAEALIKGLIASNSVKPGQIVASDRVSTRLAHLAQAYEIKVYNKNYEVIRNADIIFLTVKPQDAREVLLEIAPDINEGKLLISAAAGLNTTTILDTLKNGGLDKFLPVVRAMPNTPAIVQEGAVGICAGIGAGKAEIKLARAVFEAVGKVVVLDDEALLDAVTGLSGSGPAYAFLFMEALVEAGVELGIQEENAKLLAIQTTLGAAKLALESGKDLSELRRMVTSPGGTTMKGVEKLEEAGFKEAVKKAVKAATKRAKELSNPK